TAEDPHAGLALRTELEPMRGGAVRARHTVRNIGSSDYFLDGLEVTVPVPDQFTELLDFTGRHLGERRPQRHQLVDGLWLREVRRGRTSLESPTVLIAGRPGFSFGGGELLAAHVAFSGNTVLRAERDPHEGTTIGGGELLLPGEVILEPGQGYTSPWVVLIAADGLDDEARALHRWERGLPAHPARQPVTLNTWEAVYFRHDLARLTTLAELAAQVGVERFVLDDGWFRGRRDDRAGLGDWTVDPEVWPDGLGPLIDAVRALGMQFGLWFEPEMVNPNSELYRRHPDWILQAPGRQPLPQRNQLVLDLTRPEVWEGVRDQVDAVLAANAIDYAKWDHNRDLLDAGSNARAGRAAAHEQALAHYALLDELRRRHPAVAFESCASGGGRVDLGVVERVQRFWTSDMTDALARQRIQRWTTQLIAPEYLGAHVSAPVSHQTGRAFDLDFRAATALFGAFGIEWDLTSASAAELRRLRDWIALHKRWRPVLHGGRVVRCDGLPGEALAHGVVADDRRRALFAYVQLDVAAHTHPVQLPLPGLCPATEYLVRRIDPSESADSSDPADSAGRPDAAGPTDATGLVSPDPAILASGAALARLGITLAAPRPQTVTLFAVTARDAVEPPNRDVAS
ncbi:MAG: alpha-galactosidase, partial [Actinomycetia bacterium]|nr:alpha-galactosidase [Actinomycetes bacterium]